jgi:hypothetical protein
LHGPDLSVLFHGPDLCRGILRNLCRGILHNLHRGILHGLNGPDLCPCILLGRRPSLELLQQAFNRRLTDFGLTLIGRFNSRSSFVARRCVPCSRRQILSAGDRLDC